MAIKPDILNYPSLYDCEFNVTIISRSQQSTILQHITFILDRDFAIFTSQAILKTTHQQC